MALSGVEALWAARSRRLQLRADAKKRSIEQRTIFKSLAIFIFILISILIYLYISDYCHFLEFSNLEERSFSIVHQFKLFLADRSPQHFCGAPKITLYAVLSCLVAAIFVYITNSDKYIGRINSILSVVAAFTAAAIATEPANAVIKEIIPTRLSGVKQEEFDQIRRDLEKISEDFDHYKMRNDYVTNKLRFESLDHSQRITENYDDLNSHISKTLDENAISRTIDDFHRDFGLNSFIDSHIAVIREQEVDRQECIYDDLQTTSKDNEFSRQKLESVYLEAFQKCTRTPDE